MKNTKRLKGPERKRQILQCAVKVFARTNFQKARMADIAAEAGISEAAVYRYFPSKKAIYLEILHHMSRRILTFWQAEVDRGDNTLEILRNMGLTYFRRMIRHPDELRVQFQAVAEVSDPEIKARLQEDHRDIIKFIGGVLRKGQSEGRIRTDIDVDTLAWLMDGIGVQLNLTNLLSFKDEFDEQTVARVMGLMGEAIGVKRG